MPSGPLNGINRRRNDVTPYGEYFYADRSMPKLRKSEASGFYKKRCGNRAHVRGILRAAYAHDAGLLIEGRAVEGHDDHVVAVDGPSRNLALVNVGHGKGKKLM